MLGLLRTTLALMVMFFHLYFGILPLGTYAVFAFYIISGYLMTLIMHENYGYTLKGRYSFSANRALRLYPQYWCAALLSIAIIKIYGPNAVKGFHESIYLPTSTKDILHNLFMFFTAWSPSSINPRLVPPTWALTIEIFFYILICLGISKTFFRVKLWLSISISYVILSYAANWEWQTRYFPIAAASLPFSVGSAIFFLAKNEKLLKASKNLSLSARSLYFIFLSNCISWTILYQRNIGYIAEIGFYLNIIFSSLLIYTLATGQKIFPLSKKTDGIIGDYSYPVYLLHWQCGLIASFIIFSEAFHELSLRGLANLTLATIITATLSTILIYRLDKPIQKIRDQIKKNK
ncbi:peptidoglycan/LPS O-acetylase OafA/YrhL [Pseudomonas fluvialis]|uniref:Peptidoglycan/LPS O-acetylase OafA/YrhL n=1 Tax=Pseudomonas fluvialis TaxID=1793966 RepID=A0A7X0BUZ1_9PSED|nr:acyltransferase [Pseudomonas fluvialis]MBB6341951.1 peptidoglycan/LPS O-acetylase OafA/YrhL [Pseudomonas fluvialis]